MDYLDLLLINGLREAYHEAVREAVDRTVDDTRRSIESHREAINRELMREAVAFGKSIGVDATLRDDSLGDAVRHAFVSAKVASKSSDAIAEILGDGNELFSSNTESSEQDKHNNKVGRSFRGLSGDELEFAVWEAIAKGDLRLKDGDTGERRDSGPRDLGGYDHYDGLDDRYVPDRDTESQVA